MTPEMITEITKAPPEDWADRFFRMKKLEGRDNPVRLFRHGNPWARMEKRRVFAKKNKSHQNYLSKYPRPSKSRELPDVPQSISEELHLFARGLTFRQIALVTGQSYQNAYRKVRDELHYYREELRRRA